MPPPLGDNRFALLSASPQRKRKKAQTITKELFPALPAVIKENPKYLIASALDTSKPLSKYSCFAVHKALKNVSTDILNISELRDGNLLLFVKNINIANKFLQTKALLGICPVKFELHNNLNSTKGTIFAPCLNNVSESEIVDNLKDQGVTSVYKFLKFFDGKSTPSGVNKSKTVLSKSHAVQELSTTWPHTQTMQKNACMCKLLTSPSRRVVMLPHLLC